MITNCNGAKNRSDRGTIESIGSDNEDKLGRVLDTNRNNGTNNEQSVTEKSLSITV